MRSTTLALPAVLLAVLVFAAPASAASTTRASMTWDQPVDVDLHVHDTEGRHAWYADMSAITDAELTHDNVEGFGGESMDAQSEDFVDHVDPSDRQLAYRACYFSASTIVAPVTRVTLVVHDPGRATPRTITGTLRRVNECIQLARSPDAALAAPVARVTTPTGSVNVDPFSGEVSVLMPRGEVSDVTIQRMVRCPDNAVGGTNVVFLLNGVPIGGPPPTADPDAAGSWRAVIPAADIGDGTNAITAQFECDGEPQERPVGEIVLIDPSGDITDAVTGAPIVGATVTLHRMPSNWAPRADAADLAPDRCDSPESRIASTPWSQAVPAGGFPHDPLDSEVAISPARNPLLTTATGRYAWDVQGGSCWYVTVEKAGYHPATSALVGVAVEPVLDLDLALQPIVQPPAATKDGGGADPAPRIDPAPPAPVVEPTADRRTVKARVSVGVARAATRRSARRIVVRGRVTPVACGARGRVLVEQKVRGKWRTYGMARATRTGTYRIHTVPRARGALRATFVGSVTATWACLGASSRAVAPPR